MIHGEVEENIPLGVFIIFGDIWVTELLLYFDRNPMK